MGSEVNDRLHHGWRLQLSRLVAGHRSQRDLFQLLHRQKASVAGLGGGVQATLFVLARGNRALVAPPQAPDWGRGASARLVGVGGLADCNPGLGLDSPKPGSDRIT